MNSINVYELPFDEVDSLYNSSLEVLLEELQQQTTYKYIKEKEQETRVAPYIPKFLQERPFLP